ncbi:MAG: YIP1 family protein [Massilia sp.]
MQTTNVIDAPAASPFNALAAMFYDPTRAFAMLQARRHAWLPLVLLVASNAALLFWYFSVVDFAWLLERMFAMIADVEKREHAMKMMSKGMMQTTTMIGGALTVPLFAAIGGLYFLIVGKVRNIDFGFGKGFALSAWASVPGLLMLALGGLQIVLTPGGQLDFSQLNPVSLNQLLFHVDMGRRWAGLLDSLSVITIWGMVLTAIGFQVWARVSRATAFRITLIPYVAIYGIWAAYNLMSKAA